MSKTKTAAVQTTLPLNVIIEWPHNPRKSRDASSIEQMEASYRQQGQIMPLLVVAAADAPGLYYAIDGETRRRGMNLAVDNGKASADMPVKIEMLDPATPLPTLIAIATAANTVRQQMNPIEEMEAFRDMAAAGLKPRAIGEIFNLSSRQVAQRLALGDLIEDARNLVRSGARQLRWAEAMTVASPAQQEQIVAEIRANPSSFPDGASVKASLTKNAIPISAAKFPVDELADKITRDLFDDENSGYFTDVDAFFSRQLKYVQDRAAELSQTHKAVQIYDRERFNQAGWAEGGEPSESTAVLIVHLDGTVEEKTGLIPPAYLAGDDTNDGNDLSFLDGAQDEYAAELTSTTNGAAPVVKIEVNPLDNPTKETSSYLAAQVIANLKLKVASDPKLAKIFLIAATLTRNGALADSMSIKGLPLDRRLQTAPVFDALEARRKARDQIAINAKVQGVTSPATVVQRLMSLEDEALDDLFAWTVAESLATPLTEGTAELCNVLGMEMLGNWQIEESYLETLSSAQTHALAAEIVDIAALPAKKASINVVRKAILAAAEAKALQGNWVGTNPTWLPPQIASMQAAAEQKLNPVDDTTATAVAAAA